jgi:hypothetical protein
MKTVVQAASILAFVMVIGSVVALLTMDTRQQLSNDEDAFFSQPLPSARMTGLEEPLVVKQESRGARKEDLALNRVVWKCSAFFFFFFFIFPLIYNRVYVHTRNYVLKMKRNLV